MKPCTKCGVAKSLTEFYCDSRTSDGRYSACKECARRAANAWKRSNVEQNRQTFKAWREVNRAYFASVQKRWRSQNPERLKAYYKKFCAPCNAKRRARMRSQLCVCCTSADFAAIYAEARRRKMHVDHVKPIAKGGLHCVANLQLLTPLANLKKGCKYPEG